MSFRLRVTRQALDDIDSNFIWWQENRSPDQAARWQETVLEQIDGLTEVLTAQSCPHSREHGRKGFNYPLSDRRLGIGSSYTHRAVFTIKDDTVFVLTVRSTRQRDLEPADVPSDLDSVE